MVLSKNAIFTQTKSQLLDYIQDNLTLDDASIKNTFACIRQYKNFFEALNDLPEQQTTEKLLSIQEATAEEHANLIKRTTESENIDTQSSEAASQTPAQSLQEHIFTVHPNTPGESETPAPETYRFTRKLKGGCVHKDGVDIYVPESIIRIIHIEEGDMLSLSPRGFDSNGKETYYYEIVEKSTNTHTPDRAEVNYGLVEEVDGMLMVSRSMANGGANIKLNDEYAHTFRIHDEDRYKFKIKPGDLIDIAYNPNNTSYYRIIWKYEDEVFEQIDESRPAKAGAYKDKNNDNSNEPIKQTLTGKSVLVIGLEPRKAIFKQAIQDKGGTFLFLEGNEQTERFTSQIKKADVVIILTKFLRHRASILAVETCKEADIAYSIVDTLGIPNIIDGAETPHSENARTQLYV